jgi:hypothetical protein
MDTTQGGAITLLKDHHDTSQKTTPEKPIKAYIKQHARVINYVHCTSTHPSWIRRSADTLPLRVE